jgi:probable phosphoglycerate mutase
VERIVQAHPNQLVALFSHGDVIRTSIAHFMGTPLDLFQRIQISTASISALAFHNGRPMVLFTNYTSALPKFEWKQEASAGESSTQDGESAEQQVEAASEPAA